MTVEGHGADRVNLTPTVTHLEPLGLQTTSAPPVIVPPPTTTTTLVNNNCDYHLYYHDG